MIKTLLNAIQKENEYERKESRKQNIQPGDTVSFVGRKGETIKGEVTRTWVKKNRRFGTERMVAEVVPLSGNEGFWTVPILSCKVVKRGKGVSEKSFNVVARIKSAKKQRQRGVTNRNIDKLNEKSLLTLVPGDVILINFRDVGKRFKVFSHYTKGGKIAFRSNSKSGVRYAWPDAVSFEI